MNNTTTYIVCVPQNGGSDRFQKLLSQVTSKTEIRPGVFLMNSPATLDEWNDTLVTDGLGHSADFVFPVDTRMLAGVKNLAPHLKQVIGGQSAAA